MSYNEKIFDIELEVVRSFQAYINAQTFDKICRVLDQNAGTDTLTFYNSDVFVFAIDITGLASDWTAEVRTSP